MIDNTAIALIIISISALLCSVVYCVCCLWSQIYNFRGQDRVNIDQHVNIHINTEVNNQNIIVEQNERNVRNVSISQIRQLENSAQEDSVSINSSCSICSDRLKNPVVLPCCKNTVCLTCITKWIVNNPSCHLCRSSLKIKKDDMNMITEYLVIDNV